MAVPENAMNRVRISSKGQIVIPGEIRKKYGYSKGTELVVVAVDGNKILLERVPRLSELFGFLGDVEASKALASERESEAKAERERRKELGE